jgi:hypothetical protein
MVYYFDIPTMSVAARFRAARSCLFQGYLTQVRTGALTMALARQYWRAATHHAREMYPTA